MTSWASCARISFNTKRRRCNMADQKIETRLDKLDRLINEGNLLRNTWTQGQERACLLAALSPEVATTEDPIDCPAAVMPAWLANLTPSLDDNGSAEAWPAMVRRLSLIH